MNKPPRKAPAKFHAEPFDYHEEVDLRIDSLTNLGLGLGRIDGWVVMVPFTLPGEKVRARIYRNHSNYSEGDLLEILEPSPDRMEPVCSLFGECGGCQYQHLSYKGQLDWKRQQVAELLEHMAGIQMEVLPPIPSPAQYHYRSKITPHFQKPKKGQTSPIGFLKVGRRFDIVDVPACPIASENINQALPAARAEVHANAARYKKGATLLLRDSQEKGGTVLTDATEVCEETVGGLTFQFHAGEFFQNNPHILPAFTSHVAEEAAGDPVRYLVDAYCGSGLFCLTAASRFEKAAGVEISESSIFWAQHNARLNGIENCEFQQGDASAIFAGINFPPAETAVIIDPPRKGSSEAFLTQLKAFGPARIVYVSCNPATQMRDLKHLVEAYALEKVQPFDLFPQTRHLECVITLRRNGS